MHERTAELEAKNRELEAFTYSVSHDLKAPLRGIDGYSRLLRDTYADRLDDEGRFFIAAIRTGTRQMSQLIEDLLAYSRLERRTMGQEAIDLRAFASELVGDVAGDLVDANVSFEVNVPEMQVTADRDGLATALRNYLDNAVKFSRATAAPRIAVGAGETPTGCHIWVRDNGIGFDMSFHDRIFDIFQRLHRSEDYPGTGIGLALVKKAMERMGGRAWAQSQPGGGATFYLELPLTEKW